MKSTVKYVPLHSSHSAVRHKLDQSYRAVVMYVTNCVLRQRADRRCGLICLMVMCTGIIVEPMGKIKEKYSCLNRRK